jgi:hypothetical protein
MNVDYTKIKDRLETILRDNQTELVMLLLEEKPGLYDEIENLYPRFDPVPGKRICSGCGEEVTTFDRSLLLCEECFEDENEAKNVYQWWAVDSHWANNFRERGLVILRAFACCWWGRTCGGQGPELDGDFDFLGNGVVWNG